ncbi:hypothetical protein Mgra_00007622 [Meloidogyne graminicola]|uniref:Uncharacterized protein n=1 Tax=Meloidogyne graminicola TaxID=189291 RepID=A0A8S9ZI47_9BILA|nr:hypothetical protein Mgra_00007622 [Meloidogyne graminicola]
MEIRISNKSLNDVSPQLRSYLLENNGSLLALNDFLDILKE